MSEPFPSGEDYIVDQVIDRPGGRTLRFVFPDQRRVTVDIGNESDTPEFRDGVADAIRHRRRYMKGALLPPPPGHSAKPLDAA